MRPLIARLDNDGTTSRARTRGLKYRATFGLDGTVAEAGQTVSFALDDFGAGYTSFRYLRDFCFDMIKIDGQFVRDIGRHPDNQVLAQALIGIAKHFDMFTVAEMVETAEDAACMIEMGIDCLQGYYFGAPTIVPPWKTPGTSALRL